MIPSLEAWLLVSGTLVVVGLIAAAIAVGTIRPGGRPAAILAAARAVVLLVGAVFVWLRPGIKPTGAPTLAYTVSLLTLIVVGCWWFRDPSKLARARSFLQSRESQHLARMLGVLLTLALPAIALPILNNWDVSGWMDSQSYDAFAINIATGKAPAGESSYMPVYQYGMALVYYLFGHFFLAQQTVNALWAAAGLFALCLAAWILSGRSLAAAIVAGLFYVYSRQMFFAVHTTQIEAWYVPLICLVLLAWARYWTLPTTTRALWLGVAIGIGLSTRNQGAFFFAVVCSAPLVARDLDAKRRWWHAAVIAGVLVVILLPWTIRNGIVEKRWSPFASRSAMYVGILTDPRVGLYGIRYWEGWNEVAREYQERYPDPVQREQAYFDQAWRTAFSSPQWLVRAFAWRLTAFYGLLPDGLLELDRPRAPDWSVEWRRYVFSRMTPLVLISLSILAVAVRPSRTSAFLVAAILGHLAILLVSASSEDRVSYPVLPIHILLIAGLFSQSPAAGMPAERQRSGNYRAFALGTAAAVVLLAVLARVLVGSQFGYRPLKAATIPVAAVVIDTTLPLLNDAYRQGSREADLAPGDRVRARVLLSNYMYPPKFVGPVGFVPPFATAPGSPQYFYGYLLEGVESTSAGPAVGLRFTNAQATGIPREGAAAEIEGVLEHADPRTTSGFWLHVIKVHPLLIDHERLPKFP